MKKAFSTKGSLKENYIVIYGRHAALSAIENNNRKIKNIYLVKEKKKLDDKVLYKLRELGKDKIVERVDKKFLDDMVGKNTKHQGMVVIAYKLVRKPFEKIFDKEKFRIGVLLDKVTDPNNVGAIYRSALCFEFDFIVNLAKGSSKETSSLLNSACGAFDKVNSFYAENLVSCIKKFKKNNWWVLGTDTDANLNINNFFSIHSDVNKLLIVMGSEGSGVRRLTKEHCDFLVKIPMKNKNSLNVSNAAAIFFYETNKNLKSN